MEVVTWMKEHTRPCIHCETAPEIWQSRPVRDRLVLSIKCHCSLFSENASLNRLGFDAEAIVKRWNQKQEESEPH